MADSKKKDQLLRRALKKGDEGSFAQRGDSSAVRNAKRCADDNKYPFAVLMDLQDPVTGENKVVESYKVSGIPAKFIIDKKGNIRFKLTGFEGGNDAAVEEIAAMIELAEKS